MHRDSSVSTYSVVKRPRPAPLMVELATTSCCAFICGICKDVCLFVGRGRGVILGVLGFLDFLPGCCFVGVSPPPPLKRKTEGVEVVCAGSKYNIRSIICLKSSVRVAKRDGSSKVWVVGGGENASLSLSPTHRTSS